MSQGIINLQTYSRPKLLKDCLESIYECEGAKDLTKVIVLQTGNKEVEDLVYEFADSKTEVMQVDGSGRTPLQNMNWNRWVAWEKGFEELKASWILSIEEDIIIHSKTIKFVSKLFEELSNDKFFRGINLGSKLTDIDLNCTYSKLRFGLHGCGAAISRETWRKIKKLQIDKKIDKFPLDACIEHILKDGYMATPNLSHYLDYGWYQGTHTNSDPNDPHYLSVKESFEVNHGDCAEIRFSQVDHNWRSDCVAFERSDFLRFKLQKYLSLLWMTKFWVLVYKGLRNTKRTFFNQPRL
jgi:hypothetical protein